jgi:hypothetical protein
MLEDSIKKNYNRLKNINSLFGILLEVGGFILLTFISILTIALHEEHKILFYIILAIIAILFVMLSLESFSESLIIFSIPAWFLWILQSVGFYILTESIDNLLVEILHNIFIYIGSIIMVEFTSSRLSKGIPLRIISFIVMISRIIPFRSANLFGGMIISTMRMMCFTVLFCIYSIGLRNSKSKLTNRNELFLNLFIICHYPLVCHIGILCSFFIIHVIYTLIQLFRTYTGTSIGLTQYLYSIIEPRTTKTPLLPKEDYNKEEFIDEDEYSDQEPPPVKTIRTNKRMPEEGYRRQHIDYNTYGGEEHSESTHK